MKGKKVKELFNNNHWNTKNVYIKVADDYYPIIRIYQDEDGDVIIIPEGEEYDSKRTKRKT